ncbi:MAG: prephenate dehydratase [Candidatus Caenarcaniphilales bacterium]|nr:prephenate dehydratase [Candidatus Caenarcaniphilales bacterium]
MDDPQELLYLGPEGSYSHNCAHLIQSELLPDLRLVSCDSIYAIHREQKKNHSALGLFPVENSLGGGVSETLDGLFERLEQPQILLEWVLPIEHNLLSTGSLNQIKEVRAHYQSLAQCASFLREHLAQAEKIVTSSNSSAILSILEEDPAKRSLLAAIASKEAAELYRLPIITEAINDFKHNATRFWLIGRDAKKKFNRSDSKQALVSIAFQMPADKPGGLLKVLQSLARQDLNLTRIESRPTKGRLAEYTFFIDFVATDKLSRIALSGLLDELESLCSVFKFFGHYPVFPDPDPRFQRC